MTRRFWMVYVVLMLCGMALGQQVGMLTRADRITPEEKAQIAVNQAMVDNANKMLEATKTKVFAAHGCSAQSWMEWSTTCFLDGDFVLQRSYSWMQNATSTYGTSTSAPVPEKAKP